MFPLLFPSWNCVLTDAFCHEIAYLRMHCTRTSILVNTLACCFLLLFIRSDILPSDTTIKISEIKFYLNIYENTSYKFFQDLHDIIWKYINGITCFDQKILFEFNIEFVPCKKRECKTFLWNLKNAGYFVHPETKRQLNINNK